jgi:hypothetical protein
VGVGMGALALYPRLLGSAWDTLDASIRDLHSGGADCHLAGTFEIRASATRIGRFLCALCRLPTQSAIVQCDVLVEASEASERWCRSFGAWKFASTQFEERGLLVERIGLLDLRFRLAEEGGGLRFPQVGAYLRLLGLRLRIPRVLAPNVVGIELPGSEPGTVLIDITLNAPLVGTLIRYRGEVRRSVG